MSLGVQQLAGFGGGRRAAGGGTFTPLDLFNGTSGGSSGTEDGVWFDFSDQSTLWTTTGRTANPSASGNTRYVDDKSGNGNDAQCDTAEWVWQTTHLTRASGTTPFTFVSAAPSAQTIFVAVQSPAAGISGFKGIAATGSAMLLWSGTTVFLGTFGAAWYPSSTAPSVSTNYVFGINNGTFWVDGSTSGTYTNTSSQAHAFGGLSNQSLTFRIYSLVAIDRTLTSQELTDLNSYMAALF